jgi:serine/threonine protein phosphatase PrpC
MPWFGGALGILGGCTRSTIQSTCRGGGSQAINGNFPFLIPQLLQQKQKQQQQQKQQQRTLVLLPETFTTAASTDSSAQAMHPIIAQASSYRSFWTKRGGEEQDSVRSSSSSSSINNNNNNNNSTTTPDTEQTITIVTESSPERTVSLTYKQSFLNNPSASYHVSVCTAQGFRSYMEDEFFYSQDGEFAAVFDGHGGQAVSQYLRKNLYANVQGFLQPSSTTSSSTTTTTTTSISEGDSAEPPAKRVSYSATVQDYENAIASALDKVDREVQRISHWSYQGSTAVAIWLHEERTTMPSTTTTTTTTTTSTEDEDEETKTTSSTKKTLIAANIGDSRAVLCRNKTAYDLTRDHKPDDPLETARIEALGGQVVWCGDRDNTGNPIAETGIYRVNGNLALSRAVGDRSERPHVTADPEIITAPILEGVDDFIIIATDGLWDVFDSDDAVDFVLSSRQDGHQLERIATLVVEEALRRGTYDNITVVIIWLDRNLATTQSAD